MPFSNLFLAPDDPYGWAAELTTSHVSTEYSQSAPARHQREWRKHWSMSLAHGWKEGSSLSKQATEFPPNGSRSSKPLTRFLIVQDYWLLNSFGH